HRLDGVPVVPAAVAMELLAEFVQAGWPEHPLVELRELRVLQGITLPADAPRTVRLWARATPSAEPNPLEVTAEIRLPEGDRPCYRATLVLGGLTTKAASGAPAALQNGQTVSASDAYGLHCFHGPAFQLLQGEARVDSAGVDGELIASHPTDWVQGGAKGSSWLFDPGVVDTLLQSVILWARLERDSYPLPNRFGRLVRHGALPANQRLRFTSRVADRTDSLLEVDFLVLDTEGRVQLELQRVETSHSPALKRLAPARRD
ncbi:MAG: polyketide synthase dehydratase domain-containing protein, partial [Chromatiaceae bacterium]|nr:polyketide synthase dehydratase domain-containing protein [Chromatiaceae bacterium]